MLSVAVAYSVGIDLGGIVSWTWLVLLIYTGLSTYRLTRLVVEDDFPLVAVPRRWVVGEPGHWNAEQTEWIPAENLHEGRWFYWFGELITCPWCASGWISLGLVALVAASPSQGTAVEWLLLWFATWAVGSTLAAKIR